MASRSSGDRRVVTRFVIISELLKLRFCLVKRWVFPLTLYK
jgi:hypothetical protein